MVYILIPYILLTVCGNLLLKKNQRPTVQSMLALSFWGLCLTIIIFVINFFFISDDPFAALSPTVIALIAVRALCGAACLFCWLKTLKNIPVSIADPLFNSRMFPLLFIGWMVFADPVTTIALFLTLVVFAACFALAAVSRQERSPSKDVNYLHGILWLVLCISLSIPIVMIARHIGDQGADIVTFTTLAILFMFIISIIVVLACKQSPFKVLGKVWKDKLLMVASIPDNFWILFYIPLALSMNIGLLDAILVSASALTVLAGTVILKEKVRFSSYLLIAVILGCAVAIALIT